MNLVPFNLQCFLESSTEDEESVSTTNNLTDIFFY